jgi:hypothetical protein
MRKGFGQFRAFGLAAGAVFASLAVGGCASLRGDESEVSTVGDPHVVTGFTPILGDHDAPFPAMSRGRSGSRPLTIPSLFGKDPLAPDFLRHRSLEEKRIAAACATSQPEAMPAPPSTMDRVGSPGRGYIEKKFEKYAVAYAAQTLYPFYHSTEVTDAGFAPELAVKCFRLVRYDSKEDEIRFDVIFQLRLDSFAAGAASYRDAVQIRLLRAYFRKGSYEENKFGDKVSVSASFSVDATWFDGNRGRSETVLSHAFLPPQAFEASEEGDHFHYYGWDARAGDFSPDWSGIERLPLPPVSQGLALSKADSASDDARARDSGRRAPPVIFRVTAAEASRVPAELKLVGSLVTPTADLTDIVTGVVKRTLRLPF